jgi:hypothetical protein
MYILEKLYNWTKELPIQFIEFITKFDLTYSKCNSNKLSGFLEI